MANYQRIENFEMKDTAEVLCDFWKFNYHHDKSRCKACSLYSMYCKYILSKTWDEKWGDFETVISVIEKKDKQYNYWMFQIKDRWEIFDKLIELNKWFVFDLILIIILLKSTHVFFLSDV